MMVSMTRGAMTVPVWDAMSEEQLGRWTELLDGVAGLLPSATACVVVDGGPHTAAVADRLAGRLRTGKLLTATGWRLDTYDDPDHRFLALATRRRAGQTSGQAPRTPAPRAPKSSTPTAIRYTTNASKECRAT
jgi:hypothetical protein